jgi:hypothetical protein
MEKKEIDEVFEKLGILFDKYSFNSPEDDKDEELYEYDKPLRKGERIIIRTM